MAVRVLVLLLLVGIPRHGAAAGGGGQEALTFADGATELRTLDRAALERECGPRVVEIDDPYYRARKRFHACPLREVLRLGFGAAAERLAGGDVVVRAADGYAKSTTGDRLLEAGGWLAFGDADLGSATEHRWAPIDRRQVDPAPFYIAWERPEQRDTHKYPWPYQLGRIELVSIARDFPGILPTGVAPDAAAARGFATFRSECLACHAINGQGGKVGPDLNVPQSIVEYRPAEQIKAYIRDPQSFRYTSMPSHLHLSASDLDDLVAYFQAMKDRKRDPGAAP